MRGKPENKFVAYAMDRFSQNPDHNVDEDNHVQDIFIGLAPSITALTGCDTVAFLDLSKNNRAPVTVTGKNSVNFTCQEEIARSLHTRLEELTGRQFNKADSPIISLSPGEQTDRLQSPAAIYIEPLKIEERLYGLLAIAFTASHELPRSSLQHLRDQAGVLARSAHHLDSIRGKAWRDWLTGVFNRRGMQSELYRCWMESRRHDLPMCLLLTDLDHFKNINDSMGHQAGDMLLKEFVRFIQSTVRASDVIARFGGDEVLIILPRTAAREGLAVAERLREKVANSLFCKEITEGLQITVSVGMAVLMAGEMNNTIDDLIARADRNLLEAKRQGRNRVCLSSTEHQETKNDDAPEKITPDESRNNGTVMLVDDDARITQMMSRMLEGHGWRILQCQDAEEAITKIREGNPSPDVMIVDINLPGKSGLELLDETRLLNENVVSIVITGDSTMENALHALRRGAYDFLGKPLSLQAFNNAVERAMEVRRLRMENARYQHNLEEMVEEKSRALRETLEQVEEAHNFTLEALSVLLDLREQSSGTHSTCAREVTVVLARLMGFSEWEVVNIGRGALLHDIGKVAIPDYILLKPGPLNEQEREIMKTHCEVGYRMLADCSYLREVAEIVYQHQEHYDGSGYPQGLKEEAICAGARLFAVVDAYDAMRSHRVYREALSREESCRRLKTGAGTQFDPEVVDFFLRNIEEMENTGKWDERGKEEFGPFSSVRILQHARRNTTES